MLRLEKVSKNFGALKAVNNVSLCLKNKGISGLIGPNGSGKTTLFHLITGFYKLDSGNIYFNDQKIDGLPSYIISRKGIVRTFQHTRVLPDLSTLDNLIAAAPGRICENILPLFFQPSKVMAHERKSAQKAISILETLELIELKDSPAGDLSYGQQKLLEIGRILMAEPKLIILDEPTAGINPSLIRNLVKILKDLNGQSIKIFLIEHNMPLVSELCDDIFVMDSGNLIFYGTPEEVINNKVVIEAYLGREA